VPQRSIHGNVKSANVVGKRLRAIREGAGISHVQMLALLHRAGWDIDPAVLSRIEQGQRTLTDIEIAAMLRCLDSDWAALNE